MITEKVYIDRIRQMAVEMIGWVGRNRGVKMGIQFNTPEGVGLMMTIADAIENHFISLDGDAQRMLNELGFLRDGLSAMMLKTALEVMMQAQEKAEGKR